LSAGLNALEVARGQCEEQGGHRGWVSQAEPQQLLDLSESVAQRVVMDAQGVRCSVHVLTVREESAYTFHERGSLLNGREEVTRPRDHPIRSNVGEQTRREVEVLVGHETRPATGATKRLNRQLSVMIGVRHLTDRPHRSADADVYQGD
jgi:hypothetical protein